MHQYAIQADALVRWEHKQFHIFIFRVFFSSLLLNFCHLFQVIFSAVFSFFLSLFLCVIFVNISDKQHIQLVCVLYMWIEGWRRGWWQEKCECALFGKRTFFWISLSLFSLLLSLSFWCVWWWYATAMANGKRQLNTFFFVKK